MYNLSWLFACCGMWLLWKATGRKSLQDRGNGKGGELSPMGVDCYLEWKDKDPLNHEIQTGLDAGGHD